MSSRRKFSAEFKVEAFHRVIDSGRSVAEVARELTIGEFCLVAGFVMSVLELKLRKERDWNR